VSEPGFDRLRRRRPEVPPAAEASGDRPTDPQGRRSLFSVSRQPPPFGAVTLRCSACRQTSVVTPHALLRLALPSVHLPLLRREHPSWLRCQACGKRTWVRLGLRL
jgi:hypothetical protein